MTRAWTTAALVAPIAILLASCDASTGPVGPGSPAAGSGQVAVAFRASPAAPAAAAAAAPARTVSVDGTNGTLELQEIDLVVSKFELKRANRDSCGTAEQEADSTTSTDSTSAAPAPGAVRSSSADGQDDACEEFRADPTFVQIPLEGDTSVAVTAPVDPGTYDRLEFAVERVGGEHGDTAAGGGDSGDVSSYGGPDGVSAADLLSEIRSQVPDWPANASLLVTGTFTPTGGQPASFRVFFDAEVKIEMALDPPAVIGDGQAATFTVDLDPGAWFRDGTGAVQDLSALDYDSTGQVAQLQVELGHGFRKVERQDD